MDRGSQHCRGGSDQDHPQEEEMQRGKMVVWGDLIADKRREAKAREKYIQLDSEYQRISRRDKKAFRSDEHKEIEENNRMGKTRDLFKKTGDVKGIFYERMGMIKDRNGKDLPAAEVIKKGWHKYTEL